MQKMTSNRFRWAWWLLAYASLGLGLVGVVVPGLPTVPFVLLSAYAAARGSERLHRWLLAHRVFGPMIVDWQVHGAVSRRAKRMATLAMAACGVIMLLTAPRLWMARSEEHTSELQSLMRISYAVFCLKKKKTQHYDK